MQPEDEQFQEIRDGLERGWRLEGLAEEDVNDDSKLETTGFIKLIPICHRAPKRLTESNSV